MEYAQQDSSDLSGVQGCMLTYPLPHPTPPHPTPLHPSSLPHPTPPHPTPPFIHHELDLTVRGAGGWRVGHYLRYPFPFSLRTIVSLGSLDKLMGSTNPSYYSPNRRRRSFSGQSAERPSPQGHGRCCLWWVHGWSSPIPCWRDPRPGGVNSAI